ncbi:hypothetical protein GCM10009087_51720 [Sphingomonas oligophenolica]|uniref:DUF1398 family protein n=1 Tax=Sphingomonas oligophenolica TaxID=301154 RepID=A0ABU9Y707_9SPHN
MNQHVIETLEQCTCAADDASLRFPEIVAKLMEAGVEQYHADLLRAEKTYYLPDGVTHISKCAPVATLFATAFDAAGIAAAVRASQAQEIDYTAFCERVAAAGCTGYFVSMAGRRALYLGRTAESCVEYFPSTPRQ